jgi:hypothetical protein
MPVADSAPHATQDDTIIRFMVSSRFGKFLPQRHKGHEEIRPIALKVEQIVTATLQSRIAD